MKRVVLRDDDANALTSPVLLDRLYRPFLERGMPVHLAVIPEVRTDVRGPSGELEGFLMGSDAGAPGTHAIGENRALLDYVRREPEYVVIQHGLTHEYVDGHYEFDRSDAADIASRLDRGIKHLENAGFPRPTAFVAPQDQVSRVALREIVKRFPIVSTQFLSLRRLPRRFWPAYVAAKKLKKEPHLRSGGTTFLTHPGCILSYNKPVEGMLDRLLAAIRPNDTTVIVSHHWEYLRPNGEIDEPFVAVLHALADALAAAADVRVVRFADA